MDDAVARALVAQDAEYESDFTTQNEPLQWLIDHVDPEEQLEVGTGLLASADGRARILGARVLREDWDRREEALSLVVQAVQRETDDDVLDWLLSAAAFLGDSSALAVVEQFVHHRDPRVRDQAASAISRCGAQERSPSAQQALITLADDPHEEVRFSALFELAQWWQDGHNHPEIERRLRAALDGEDPRGRRIATEAFATVAPQSG